MRWENKRPTEVRVYAHDWSNFLGSDTISTSAFTVSGATKDSESSTATTAIVVISAGTLGDTVTVTNTITTAGGKTEIEVFTFLISDGEEPISVQEAKEHLRVTTTNEDALIASRIIAAREWVENYTGYILVQREVEDAFPAWGEYLTLRHQPITVGDPTPAFTVEYTDEDGNFVELTDYILRDQSYPWFVYPSASGFPDMGENGTARVTYTAGYANPAAVPQALKQALLLLIAQWHMNRAGVSGDGMTEIPFAVTSLCRPYRGAVLA